MNPSQASQPIPNPSQGRPDNPSHPSYMGDGCRVGSGEVSTRPTPEPLTLWHVALVRPDGITRRRLLMDRAAVDALLELVKGEGETHLWTAQVEWQEVDQ